MSLMPFEIDCHIFEVFYCDLNKLDMHNLQKATNKL
jgi:hypothetical protein